MSRVNDIKNMKRNQRVITPSQVLAETVGEEEKENNVDLKQETNKQERKKRKWKENVYPLIYGRIYIKN